MFQNLLDKVVRFVADEEKEESIEIPTNSSHDSRLEMEYREFLPEVYDTWTCLQTLSTDVTRFRDIYDLYQYERTESQRQIYFDQLKHLDDSIYKFSLNIQQRLQTLEKLVRPIFDEHRRQSEKTYVPASIRIGQNQLNSLKFSFQRLIVKHNENSLKYQNDLKRSVDPSTSFVVQDEENPSVDEQLQLKLSEQELQIADLEARLESVRILKDRVRQMNEMTMALYLSVQEQNEMTDNIWLNTSTGSDYINQSIDEFRLVKKVQQSKMNLWIKLTCLAFCFLLVLFLILTLILVLIPR